MEQLARRGAHAGLVKTIFIPSQIEAGPCGPLVPHIKPYLAQLDKQGYATGSAYEQICVLELFGHWLERTGRKVCDLNEAVADEFLSRVMKRRRWPQNPVSSTLRRLLALLRKIGIVSAAEATDSSPSQQLACAYEHFLLAERNLSQGTGVWHRRFISRFLFEKFGNGPLTLLKLKSRDVTGFVLRHAHRHSPAEARSLVAAMRSFLRYLHYKGLVKSDLSLAVPKVARCRFRRSRNICRQIKRSQCCVIVTEGRRWDGAITPF